MEIVQDEFTRRKIVPSNKEAIFAIAGATGHSGHVVAEQLLSRGRKVRAIGRSEERLQPLVERGAEAAICDLSDRAALAKAFAGADGVYAMIPPKMDAPDFRAYQDQIIEALAGAIAEAGVKHVVTLSSVGADKSEKTGPIVGLHILEEKLNQIPGLNVLHLRPGYFMENTLAQIGAIKTIGVVAGPLRAELEIAMTATRDIGEYAARRLARLDFSGSQTQELLGERDISMAGAAGIIGRGIGRPHLSYTRISNDEFLRLMVQMGASKSTADLMVEMSEAMNAGHVAPLEKRSKENSTPTSYETFVKEELAPRFLGKPAVA
jgi:uncharacterized protein YbjT (DUF2867 family)